MINERKKLELFENFRKDSIDLLDNSIIDKDTFLNKNYNYLVKLDLKPFASINTVNEAIYNYHYYNLMAKKANLEAQRILHHKNKKKNYLKLINKRENYYYLKDIASLRLLELIEFKDVESYFISLNSKRLKGEIFEIRINCFDKVILHSKNKHILEMLKDNNVFSSAPRKSIIDSYVNKSY